MHDLLEKHPWWGYINEDLQELLRQSLLLLDVFANEKHNGRRFHDYAFVVFPAAKAYEGFLKTLFRDMGLISDLDFYGNRFRIGKALNPALDKKFRNESVYDGLVDFCGGKRLPDKLWNAWKKSRNILFHWFPQEKNAIDYLEAKERLKLILDAMDSAFEECEVENMQI